MQCKGHGLCHLLINKFIKSSNSSISRMKHCRHFWRSNKHKKSAERKVCQVRWKRIASETRGGFSRKTCQKSNQGRQQYHMILFVLFCAHALRLHTRKIRCASSIFCWLQFHSKISDKQRNIIISRQLLITKGY